MLAFFVGSDFLRRLDVGEFLLESMLPAEASLDQVERLNHRVELDNNASVRGMIDKVKHLIAVEEV